LMRQFLIRGPYYVRMRVAADLEVIIVRMDVRHGSSSIVKTEWPSTTNNTITCITNLKLIHKNESSIQAISPSFAASAMLSC